MKFAILFLVVIIALSEAKRTPEEEDKAFNDYLDEFKINRGEHDVMNGRKKTFLERLDAIEKHNSGKSTYKLGLNKFSHLTHEERARHNLGYIPRSFNDSANSLPPPISVRRRRRSTAPAAYDWRNVSGVVRAVQDQGQCGSCWAFASIAAAEGQMALKHNAYDKLSEQEIIECASSNGVLLGCNGGFASATYTFSMNNKGVTSQSNDPYVATTNGRSCVLSRPRTPNSAVTQGWYAAPQDEASVRDYLYNYGPLYVSFCVVDEFFSYAGGIYDDSKKQCPGYASNHAVLLVGYGTTNGVDYWIVKNSWGANWGLKGYFMIKRGVFLCNMGKEANFPNI